MIPLTNYADLLDHTLADAIHEAATVGLTLNAHASPVDDGGESITEDAALVAGVEDPSLIYITGTDEQTGETAAQMARRWAEG